MCKLAIRNAKFHLIKFWYATNFKNKFDLFRHNRDPMTALCFLYGVMSQRGLGIIPMVYLGMDPVSSKQVFIRL